MFATWIEQIRPKTLLASIAPIILGTSFSYLYQKQINIINLILFSICILTMQIISNLVNDYVDTKRNTDSSLRQGMHRPIHRGLISHIQLTTVIRILTIIALIVGTYLSTRTHFLIFFIGFFSMLLSYGYTAGKYPISYLGFGEVIVFLVFGPLATQLVYYIQTLSISYDLFIASIGIGSIATGILLVNNIRDYQTDKQQKKKTLIVYITPLGGKFFYLITIFFVPNFVLSFFIKSNLKHHIYIYLFILTLSTLLSYNIFTEKILNKYNRLLSFTAIFLFIYSLLQSVVVLYA